jgi:hypothetical protein
MYMYPCGEAKMVSPRKSTDDRDTDTITTDTIPMPYHMREGRTEERREGGGREGEEEEERREERGK